MTERNPAVVSQDLVDVNPYKLTAQQEHEMKVKMEHVHLPFSLALICYTLILVPSIYLEVIYGKVLKKPLHIYIKRNKSQVKK